MGFLKQKSPASLREQGLEKSLSIIFGSAAHRTAKGPS
jgi:hypothetical protein